VPFLIDGNNLLYAVRNAGLDVGPAGLCAMLGRFADSRQRVRVVFDGPPPPAPQAEQIAETGVEALYAAPRSADELIAEAVATDTAPRRLTVVSTDRAVRRAARRRRCRLERSDEFADRLMRFINRPPRPGSVEPPEKRRGLTPEQTEAWLKELDLDTEAGEKGRNLP